MAFILPINPHLPKTAFTPIQFPYHHHHHHHHHHHRHHHQHKTYRSYCPVLITMTTTTAPTKVLVFGATGRCGRLVITRLSNEPTFIPIAFIRNPNKASKVLASNIETRIGDVCDIESLNKAMKGIDSIVILSSAIPLIDKTGEYYYPSNGTPETVDYKGGCNIIDMSKKHDIKRIIYVGSMGSTDKTNIINKIGGGHILEWKRKAEEYLINSGLCYTIINPGGLIDENGEKRELVVGKADRLKNIYAKTVIPRDDVARVVVEALKWENAQGKAFDLIAKEVGEGKLTEDFKKLFEKTTGGLE